MAAKKQSGYALSIFKDFKGGWNADGSPDTMQDNELEILENVETTVVGALPRRKGTAPLTAKLAGEVTTLIEWNRKDGSTYYVGVVGNDLVIFTNLWKPITLLALSDPEIGYFFFQDYLYFTAEVGSTDKYYRYGGGVKQVETATVVGTITLAGNATVVVTAAGMTGSPKTVNVAVALNDTASQVATKIQTALLADSAVSGMFNITTSGANVILTRGIEAADDATMNVSIDNGTCTGLIAAPSSTNTTAGIAGLVEVTPGSASDLDPIKRCRIFVWNPKNFKIYAAGDPQDQSCLYYSEANDPTIFKTTSKVYPTMGEGKIRSLSYFSSGIVVGFLNALWSWTGVDVSTDAVWAQLPITHGIVGSRAWAITPNSMTVVGQGGLYAISPGALDKQMILLQGSKLSVNLSVNKVGSVIQDAINREDMAACYQQAKNRLLIAYCDDANENRNNKILVLDWEMGSFSCFTGIYANCFCPCDNGDILVGSGHYVIQMEQGYNDWDVDNDEYKAIRTVVYSKQWDCGSPYHIKKLKRTYVGAFQFKTVDTTLSQMSVKVAYNDITFLDALLDESFSWGEDWGRIWGWTDVVTKEFKTKLKGHRIQWICIHEEMNEDFLIYGVALQYKLKRAKGVKYGGDTHKNFLS